MRKGLKNVFVCPALSRTRFKKQGFTLIEVGVVAVILLLLGVMLVSTFSNSTAAMSLGSTKVEVDSLARITIDRISPLIMTAKSLEHRDEATRVDWDASDPTIPADTRIFFTTTEDFFAPGYSSQSWQAQLESDVFNLEQAHSYEYVIFFYDADLADDENPGEVRLMRRADWVVHEFTAEPPGNVPYQRLGGVRADDNGLDATGITAFRCRRVLDNTVQITLRVTGNVKRDNGNTERTITEFTSLVSAPSMTYQ